MSTARGLGPYGLLLSLIAALTLATMSGGPLPSCPPSWRAAAPLPSPFICLARSNRKLGVKPALSLH